MKTKIAITLILLCTFACGTSEIPAPRMSNTLRAPAYPLVSIDPYTSAWSFTDQLYDSPVRHWTGAVFPLTGIIRVDGKPFRFMGIEQPPLKTVAATAEKASWNGRFSFSQPPKGWETVGFNDAKWKEGPAAFGTPEETGVKTLWTGDHTEIWVRRELTLDTDLSAAKVFLEFSHDDDFELYVNGVEAVNTGFKWRKNVWTPLPDEARQTLKEGRNVIAAHCRNRTHGALVDFGLYVEEHTPYLTTAAMQQSVDVQATRTHYRFACGPVNLTLTFTAPLLLRQLDVMSRPVNYISYAVTPSDGQTHDVQLYLEASPLWALDKPHQQSVSEIYEKDGLVFLKTGSRSQKILEKRGDNVRIDWGYCYLAAQKEHASTATGDEYALRKQFAENGSVTAAPPAGDGHDKLALALQLGNIHTTTAGKVMIGYDDLYAIRYFGENLRPYWNRNGDKTIESAFAAANSDYHTLMRECSRWDDELMRRATDVGGKEYAELCALAYRQAIAAHKLVQAPNGDLLFLSKENFSNGSIGTVDITYPSAPLFLLYNTELVKGLLNHIFYYSESGKWTKPFAAHDVGTYPHANGQTYGGDMPVEECGNMLIITAAVAAKEGNAAYAEKHWPTLTTWTDYLVEKGLDPENQLCTDDFAGHFAHNANLSVKAILGIASYGKMAAMLGKKDAAKKYTDKARQMAQEWVKMADDGDHFRLTFDQPGTWSQKYNMVWDKLLKLDIFPAEVIQKEIPYYLSKQNQYGLPLDNRRAYTKSDWIMWTATLSPDQQTFEQLIRPLHRFMNETTDRIPMSDWYNTDSKKHVGFRARSVVGGYFIRLLAEEI
ncbi:MAG: DUF4965 domain-containing protein [Bacteroidales bacterium]|jgi:hypothetical protein|nr:DUF4965 domain-containing protein [Bacteroidales bacterium]